MDVSLGFRQSRELSRKIDIIIHPLCRTRPYPGRDAVFCVISGCCGEWRGFTASADAPLISRGEIGVYSIFDQRWKDGAHF